MLTGQTGYHRLPPLRLRRVPHLPGRSTSSRTRARLVSALAVEALWRPADGAGVRGPRSVGAEEEEEWPVVPPGRCRSIPAGRLRDKRPASPAAVRRYLNGERNARREPVLFRGPTGPIPAVQRLPQPRQARRSRLSPV